MMATCKGCVHYAVCQIHGEVFITRNDVDRICENFMDKTRVVILKKDDAEENMNFGQFWASRFAKNNG